MPEFLPFVGTRYNAAKVRIENVVAPPYDVISKEFRDLLYERDPHNVVRLELSRESNPYASAADLLSRWKREEILRYEDSPAYYIYHQIFDKPNGEQVTRTGVIGRLRVTPYSEKQVLPHERTLTAPKRDRLELMERTHANLSPIFGLISDPAFVFDHVIETATAYAPLADIIETLQNGNKVRHIMWRVDDALTAERIQRIVDDKTIIIADGHHRYETSLEYHERHPEDTAASYMMIFLSNVQSEGTVILPTHRLLHDTPDFNQYRLLEKLRSKFTLIQFSTREEGVVALEQNDLAWTLIEFPEDPKFVLVADAESRTRAEAKIAAGRLEDEILKPLVGLSTEAIDAKTNLLYPHTLHDLDEMKESASWDAAFVLRSIRPDEMLEVVQQGGYMPQKSTYFYPKLLTGLVIHEFATQRN